VVVGEVVAEPGMPGRDDGGDVEPTEGLGAAIAQANARHAESDERACARKGGRTQGAERPLPQEQHTATQESESTRRRGEESG